MKQRSKLTELKLEKQSTIDAFSKLKCENIQLSNLYALNKFNLTFGNGKLNAF
jgi:hypothetical protein